MIAFARIAIRQSLLRALLCVAMLFVASTSRAAIITIDFESYLEGDLVGTVGPATFSGAQAQMTDIFGTGLLNHTEVLPVSGLQAMSNAVFDLLDPFALAPVPTPVEISFSTPILSFSGYFTYESGLTIEAYDIANNLVDSTSGAFASNLISSGAAGSSPNEFLSVFGAAIRKIIITGSASDKAFVADDITFDTKPFVGPEPASLLLLAGGLAGLVGRRLRASRSRA